MTIHAEISIIPISHQSDTSMSKGVAAAFDAIQKAEGVRATLTALGTQIEADSLNHVINAIRDAHEAAKRAGALRIVSTIRIDERLDKSQTLEDKVDAVRQRLKE